MLILFVLLKLESRALWREQISRNFRSINYPRRSPIVFWNIVITWDSLAKDTVGKQIVRSADSIGANIAEGSGRGSHQDNRRFVRMARGSLYETMHWLRRSYMRKLLSQAEVKKLQVLIEELTPKLNAYLRSVDQRVKSN